jgi:hypothetical protein
MEISASIVWIKAEFGGRKSPPVVGLRPIIRFQRFLDDWLRCAWDVELTQIEFDEQYWSGVARFELSKNAPKNLQGLKEGELIELLDGYRVIGVGRIISVVESPTR